MMNKYIPILLGISWGILMVSQDLNTYYLYVLLLSCDTNVINCQNFLKYYTFFSILYTVLSAIFYPISGYITDKTSNRPFFVLNISNIIQFISISLQIIPSLAKLNYIFLLFFWEISQVVAIQNTNSLWKIIKKYTETQSTEFLINKIGNMGDITSDILESSIMCIYASLMYYASVSYTFILFLMLGIIMFVNILLCMISFYLSHHLSSYLSSYSSNISENILDNNITNKLTTCQWFKSSCYDFIKNRLVYHVFWHCMILILYSGIVQYPLSFIEVNIIKTNSTKFCNGVLTNLIIIGAITNILYLAGSITYRIFFVSMIPRNFYRYWYILTAIILIGGTISLNFELNPLILYIIISIITVIPYYMSYYSYYLFTEKGNEHSYGFILGLYGLINTIFTILSQYLYILGIAQLYLIITSIVIIILTIIYSLYISNLTLINN